MACKEQLRALYVLLLCNIYRTNARIVKYLSPFKKQIFPCNFTSLICDKCVTAQNLAFLSCWYRKKSLQMQFNRYRGADKSLALPTSRCILFNGENISFDASLVMDINSSNIPPIMIINRIYENQNLPLL